MRFVFSQLQPKLLHITLTERRDQKGFIKKEHSQAAINVHSILVDGGFRVSLVNTKLIKNKGYLSSARFEKGEVGGK